MIADVTDTVLVVEDEVFARTALAEYLRHCGYRVIEAPCEEDARTVLSQNSIPITVLFNAIPGFELVQWTRANHPEVLIVSAGNLEKAARAAGELCAHGPHLKKPYEPEQVIEWIKRLKVPQS